MKKSLTIMISLALSSCMTAGDESYCKQFRIAEGSTEYANCKAYYARMDNWFSLDRNGCKQKAAQSVPDYLYDHARYGEAQTIDRFGMIRTTNIVMEPDYSRNRALDAQRESIIAPCMASKGWKDSMSWQAGRTGQNAQSAF